VGFIFAAALVGWLAQREWDRRWLRTALSFLLGSVVMYAFGLPWLYASMVHLSVPNPLQYTLVNGLYVFLVGDVLKAVLAGVLLPLAWRGLGRLDRKDA
jgi:biotin transport system substrate-specific component